MRSTCLAGDGAVLAVIIVIVVLLSCVVLVGTGGDLLPRQLGQNRLQRENTVAIYKLMKSESSVALSVVGS